MNVLWFSNIPALGSEKINEGSKIKSTGGWLHSLNRVMQEEVELSIAFHYHQNISKFTYQKTNYYPIFNGNVILESIKSRFFGKIYDTDFIDQYLSIINEVKPDIIHLHGTENPFLCILEHIDIPFVISIQGNLTVYHHKFFAGYHGRHIALKDNYINWKTLLLGRHSFLKTFRNMKKMSLTEQHYLISAENIIGRTSWDRRISRILAPRSNYYVGNEILREGFYENKWNNVYDLGKIVITTINGDNYYKGFETLAHSLSLLIDLGLEVEWRVAGISEGSLINRITKRELGRKYPKSGLVLLGAIDEESLIENMLDSHLYIMTSHIENSPNNLCEAMMLGMPCISSFAGGTESMMENGKEGLLIQDGDPWSLAGAVIELISDREKLKFFGLNARNRALERHNKDKVLNEFISIYSSVLKVAR